MGFGRKAGGSDVCKGLGGRKRGLEGDQAGVLEGRAEQLQIPSWCEDDNGDSDVAMMIVEAGTGVG